MGSKWTKENKNGFTKRNMWTAKAKVWIAGTKRKLDEKVWTNGRGETCFAGTI